MKIQQGIHGNRRYSTEPPITVAFIIAFVIEAFAILYVSGTLMMIMWWLTNNQWAGFLAALAVSSFENMAYMGFLHIITS